jgi:hypothetical protein
MKCPCCPAGEITEARICDTCGVGIARGAEAKAPEGLSFFNRRKRRRRPDQDEQRLYAEYAATKEDKQ